MTPTSDPPSTPNSEEYKETMGEYIDLLEAMMADPENNQDGSEIEKMKRALKKLNKISGRSQRFDVGFYSISTDEEKAMGIFENSSIEDVKDLPIASDANAGFVALLIIRDLLYNGTLEDSEYAFQTTVKIMALCHDSKLYREKYGAYTVCTVLILQMLQMEPFLPLAVHEDSIMSWLNNVIFYEEPRKFLREGLYLLEAMVWSDENGNLIDWIVPLVQHYQDRYVQGEEYADKERAATNRWALEWLETILEWAYDNNDTDERRRLPFILFERSSD